MMRGRTGGYRGRTQDENYKHIKNISSPSKIYHHDEEATSNNLILTEEGMTAS